MRVTVLSGASRNEGGLFYSVRWLSQALHQSGVDIRMLSHIDEHTAEDLPLWDPVDIQLYPAFGPLLSSFKGRNLLHRSSADLVHVHGIWLDRQWASLQWQQRTGGPVVLSPRGMLDPWAVRNSAWKKKLVGGLFANRSLRRASCIHALCEAEAEAVRAYGLRGPVAVIPNGVELPELSNSVSHDRKEKKQLLFLGRIHPKKGLSELLAGWAGLRAIKPDMLKDWNLMIGGWDDGGYLYGLQAQVAELGLQESVTFLGAQYGSEKDTLLRRVDAFILPSFSEGLPMSVLEAWAYGLPVVMTDHCNLPSGFASDAAVRVEPDAKSITQKLLGLGDRSADDLRAMGARGRRLVEQKFTWDQIARDMKAVYTWCLGGDKPACIETR